MPDALAIIGLLLALGVMATLMLGSLLAATTMDAERRERIERFLDPIWKVCGALAGPAFALSSYGQFADGDWGKGLVSACAALLLSWSVLRRFFARRAGGGISE